MKNRSLRDEVKNIVKNKENVSKVYRGVIGGQPSIEIAEIEPKSVNSIMYTSEKDRDEDLNELQSLLK